MTRGGLRKGAGRPAGTGKFGSPTQALRVPSHLVHDVLKFIEQGKQTCPLYFSAVKAGFPSPAEDYADQHLDLNTHLIHHPSATFFLRVSGYSMKNAGILDGDLLIVDRSLEPSNGKIVIAAVNGELTVKRFKKTSEGVFLIAENEDYPPIALSASDQLQIWGVVTHAIHTMESK
jgi:DNA polymerase V